jgi:hypothetical protein
MSSEVDPHTPHWHGKLVKINGEYPDVAEDAGNSASSSVKIIGKTPKRKIVLAA